MFIESYMTSSPVTIQPDSLISTAVSLLQSASFRHLPVIDENGILLGMLTDRDLRSACPSSMLKDNEKLEILDRIKDTRVKDIMSTEFIVLSNDATLDDALMLFKTRSIGALPVVDRQKRVVGIFSLNDMMAAYRNLFGLGEKGSVLVSIEDNDDPHALRKLVTVLEEKNVLFTRLIRTQGTASEAAMIYLRINTYNVRSVHRAIEQAGFTLHHPEKKEIPRG